MDSLTIMREKRIIKTERQVDDLILDLKIQNATNDVLKTYISEENNQLSRIGIFFAILVSVVGIVIPLFLYHAREEGIKNEKKR